MQVDSLPAEPQWKPKNTGVASMGLIPSWGTKILHAMWPKKKKKNWYVFHSLTEIKFPAVFMM